MDYVLQLAAGHSPPRLFRAKLSAVSLLIPDDPHASRQERVFAVRLDKLDLYGLNVNYRAILYNNSLDCYVLRCTRTKENIYRPTHRPTICTNGIIKIIIDERTLAQTPSTEIQVYMAARPIQYPRYDVVHPMGEEVCSLYDYSSGILPVGRNARLLLTDGDKPHNNAYLHMLKHVPDIDRPVDQHASGAYFRNPMCSCTLVLHHLRRGYPWIDDIIRIYWPRCRAATISYEDLSLLIMCAFIADYGNIFDAAYFRTCRCVICK